MEVVPRPTGVRVHLAVQIGPVSNGVKPDFEIRTTVSPSSSRVSALR